MHGDLKPGNVMVTDDRAVILDFGFAQERARARRARPGAPPDGGTPNYMSPERLRSGGASPEDDVYALGLTLWEMWTCRVPEPGYKPRAKPMRAQIMFDVPAGLSIDEIKQIFRCLSEDADAAPAGASHALLQPDAAHDEPDPGPARASRPGAAARARGDRRRSRRARSRCSSRSRPTRPRSSGQLFPLDKPLITIGRRGDQDIVVPEADRVAARTRVLRWQAGSWIIEDLGSTNGTYADHSYERKKHGRR